MEQSKQSKNLLLIITVPIIFIILISPGGGYKLQQRNKLIAMDSTELLENDGTEIEPIFKAIVEEKDELLIEWPQGWRRFLLRQMGLGALPTTGIRAKTMPCCAESIGPHVCSELRNRNPLLFRKRCKLDADFAILQCCRSCRTNVAELGRELFAAGLKSRHCFDRHNRQFCAHFVHQSGMWAANVGKSVNCNGGSASLAFRMCRRSCGFCDPELYQQQSQNRNCISSMWKMTSTNGPPPTATSSEHWRSKTVQTTTAQSKPFPPSSSSSRPTKSVTMPSRKPTKIGSRISSPTPASSPPTIQSTGRPIGTPQLRPCTVPPLPPLPPIPVPSPLWRPSPRLPLEPLAPLKSLTPATIVATTYSAPWPRPTTPSPPPLPSRPQRPFGPIEPPKAGRRSGTTITITWKPSPTDNGLWPELPIPLPDEIIEVILNKLSGIDGDGATEECSDEKEVKEKGGRESASNVESAEKRERAENWAEESDEKEAEEQQQQQHQVEEGVRLFLDALLKAAAEWVGTDGEEESDGGEADDQQQRDEEDDAWKD